MIYAVTLNPAIDRTIQLNTFTYGMLNVAEKSMYQWCLKNLDATAWFLAWQVGKMADILRQN